MLEKGTMLVTRIFLHYNVSYPFHEKYFISATFNSTSTNKFNMDKSKCGTPD